jgi:Histidine-specific methyltransferase, SAM-dependent
LTLRSDPCLAAILCQELPANWATRRLFSGPDAMRLYAQRPRQYADLEVGDAVVSAYDRVVGSCGPGFRSFISIGSGDGYVDLSLPLDWTTVRYFPVDISIGMVQAAVDTAKRRGVAVSGLVADAEDAASFLQGVLSAEATPPRLVVCLGNTLGNVDTGEQTLLIRLARLLAGPNCRLMLSVALGRFPSPIDRATFDSRVGWGDLAGLFAAAVVRRSGEAVRNVEQEMPERLVVTAAASDVPHADTLLLSDRPSGAALLHLRRYSLSSLLRWLEEVVGLRVVASQDCPLPGTDDVRLGIVLLARGQQGQMSA